MRAIIVLLFLLLPLSVNAEQRYALLIGNEDYPGEVGRLTNPHQDAQALRGALHDAGFEVALLEDGTQTEILIAVANLSSKLKRAGDEGVGFFYYSGHGGSAESSGIRRNYLMPAKTPIVGAEQLPVLGVPMSSIIESFSAANAKAVFVVMDACRNTLPWTSEKGGAADKGFVPIQTRSGMFIAYATADGATAPDDGLFARSLAREIRRDGQTADRAFTLAFRSVAQQRRGDRLPFFSPGLLEDICFGFCSTINEREQELTDASPTAIERNTIGDLEPLRLDTKANRIVILVDLSSSMRAHEDLLKTTVKRLIESLDEEKKFTVIGFRDSGRFVFLTPDSELISTTMENRHDAFKFVDDLVLEGGTGTYSALQVAMRTEAEAIVMLTDGEPSDATQAQIVSDITTQNSGTRQLFSIAIGNSTDNNTLVRFLRDLAASNDGELITIKR